MKKLLYFTCPTDSLEIIINEAFNHENYYCSSLGNSIIFDNYNLKETKKLIKKKKIKEIIFVLSNYNRIVLDAFGNQGFSNIKGLNNFYQQVNKEKERAALSWKTGNPQFLILSYYLNQKIKELKHGLRDSMLDQLLISGKIYNQQQQVFKDIYSDLICMDHKSFN